MQFSKFAKKIVSLDIILCISFENKNQKIKGIHKRNYVENLYKLA